MIDTLKIAGSVGRLSWLLLVSSVAFSQADTARTKPATDLPTAVDSLISRQADSLAVPDSSADSVTTAASLRPLQGLLQLLALRNFPREDDLDFPQFSSRLDYDPLLVRVYQAPWGGSESIYPLGLPPSHLSRADDLFGDGSFANPVPVPQSETLLRLPPSSSYQLLTPAVSQLVNPFGRLVTLYQDLPDFGGDVAYSKIHVTRGRGAFANTYLVFGNRFGTLGTLWFDGNFIKYDGLRLNTDSQDDRMRLIISPGLHERLSSRIAFFFNRLAGRSLFFPPGYAFNGSISDNYSGAAAAVIYSRDAGSASGVRLSYVNDEQTFSYTSLNHRQRFQVTEGRMWYDRRTGRHNLELETRLRYYRYHVGSGIKRAVDFRVATHDLLSLSNHLQVFGSLSLIGGKDYATEVAATAALHYRYNQSLTASLLANHSYIYPQPEMKYLPAKVAAFGFAEPDYRLSGNEDLGLGSIDAVEAIVSMKGGAIGVELRGGGSKLVDLPVWQVERSDYPYGAFTANAIDRKLAFFCGQLTLDLPYDFYISGAYGFSRLFRGGVAYTYGPEHSIAGLAGGTVLIPKIKVYLSGAFAVKYRSATARYFEGGADDDQLVAESSVSFDLKRFHFFYNFYNVLSAENHLNGLLQPGRSLWWGFTWELLD